MNKIFLVISEGALCYFADNNILPIFATNIENLHRLDKINKHTHGLVKLQLRDNHKNSNR